MRIQLIRFTRICFRPIDRTSDDLDTIFSKLKDVKAFEKFHPLLIQQLCYYSYFESLERSVTRRRESLKDRLEMIFFLSDLVFRTGDLGANWFAILVGSVDVCVPSDNGKVCSVIFVNTKNFALICFVGSYTYLHT